MTKVGEAYVGEDGQWSYYTEKDILTEQQMDDVVHQLMHDWSDTTHKHLVRELFKELPTHKIRHYMKDVKKWAR